MLTKHTGNLYGKIIDDLAQEGIASSEILHIGDNAHADIQNASEHGLKTFHIECGTSVLQKSEWFRKLDQPFREADLFWLGLIANFFFDPFKKAKHPVPETMEGFVQGLLQSGDRTQTDLIAMLRCDRLLPEKRQ